MNILRGKMAIPQRSFRELECDRNGISLVFSFKDTVLGSRIFA